MLNSFCIVLVLLPTVILGCTYSQFGSDHTMCKYAANACTKTVLARGITEADKAAVLKAHNTYRNKVASGQQSGQPSAANMQELSWDAELSTVAQRWADQCTFGHDSNRRTASYSYVGQNVALTGSSVNTNSAADFSSPTTMWYNEVTNPGFNSANIDPYKFDSGSGHYTQVVWATSKKIGCGYIYYKDGSWYYKLYVCNYGPGGNIIGGSMYKKGTTASQCPNGKSSTYSGLCK